MGDMYNWRKFLKDTTVEAETQDGWPLHAKKVEPLFIDIVSLWAAQARMGARWKRLRRFLDDDKLYASALPEKPIPHFSKVHDSDLSKLISAGIIEPAGPLPKCFCRVFTVAEIQKVRRRFICHTVEVNNAFPSALGVKLPSIRDVISQVSGNQHAVHFDLKSWFYQFPLSSRVSVVFSSTLKPLKTLSRNHNVEFV